MKHIRDEKEIFSKNRRPVGCEAFNFACHKEIECFTLCCRNVDIDLYPYDILRMKNHLGITSEEFLSKYTFTVFKDNPNFPNVKLRLMDDDTKRCPFLTEDGCGIYRDRPDACRTYPLERAVSLAPFNLPMRREFYFLVQQPICKGHFEEKKWTVKQWIEDQELKPFNDMNDLWVEVDILLRSLNNMNMEHPKMKMAFMASYNLDEFRKFIFGSSFLKRFKVEEKMLEKLHNDDVELYKFGIDWIKFFLFNVRPEYFRPA